MHPTRLAVLASLGFFLGCSAHDDVAPAASGAPASPALSATAESSDDAGPDSAAPDASASPVTPGPSFTVPASELHISDLWAPSGISSNYTLTTSPSGDVATLAAGPGATGATWSAATVTRPIGDDILGRRYRLRAKLQTDDVKSAFLWLRIDTPTGWTIDNMAERRLEGTSGWADVSIVLDVDDEAVRFAFGFAMTGPTGSVSVRDIRLEEVGPKVATTPSFSGGL